MIGIISFIGIDCIITPDIWGDINDISVKSVEIGLMAKISQFYVMDDKSIIRDNKLDIILGESKVGAKNIGNVNISVDKSISKSSYNSVKKIIKKCVSCGLSCEVDFLYKPNSNDDICINIYNNTIKHF
jgi:hypothetical protein